MTETLIHQVQGAMSSPWVYALLFALAAIDGFFPVVPGESAVITAGVFAASGRPELFAVIGVAALDGAAFEHDPVKGLPAGFVIAISITVLVETVRHVRTRTAGKRQGPARPPDAGAPVCAAVTQKDGGRTSGDREVGGIPA